MMLIIDNFVIAYCIHMLLDLLSFLDDSGMKLRY